MSDYLERGAGILLHISSLPSDYGIGTMGKAAFDFIDQLKDAGQKYWQVLPVGQTSFGDSPYQAFSAFAGNPYFIDVDNLINDGLATKEEVDSYYWGGNTEYVDYDKIYNARYDLLRKAYDRWKNNKPADFAAFENENSEWLNDYALFMTIKGKFNYASWLSWDKDIKDREPAAIEKYMTEEADTVGFWKFLQYRFYGEWKKLKEYANSQGIKIIGDIPIYVALDSCDVWSNTKIFQLDENNEPTAIAGCPPDAFSEDGQRWGNPLYAWDTMEKDDFSWWKKRIKASAALYDVIRIDHFIGVVRYWSIPVDKATKDGHFEMGPGNKLTKAISSVLGDAKIIAEDLGVQYDPVQELLDEAGYPGMKVMIFGFDGDPKNEHLPHNLKRDTILYIGTHDNETLMGYVENQPKELQDRICEYVSAPDKKSLCSQMIKTAYLSVAPVTIIQMQDILEKNNFARMNFPSTMGDNWRWRLQKGEFTKKKIEMLKKFAHISAR